MGLKPLPKKTSARTGSTKPISTASAGGGFSSVSPRQGKRSYPKFKRPRISTAMKISAPRVSGV
jgi:hypothetical protein